MFSVQKTVLVFLAFFLSSQISLATPKKKTTPIANKSPSVQISPSGPVETAEQVQVVFSDAMIELGQSGNEAPVESNCFLTTGKSGSGYWTNEKTWVYTFNSPPAPNTTCTITVKTDLKTLDNRDVKSKQVSFKTLNAQIVAAFPRRYENIDSNQYFVLFLNGEPDLKWVEQNVYFTTSSLGDHVAAQILSEDEKNKVIKELKENKTAFARFEDYEESEIAEGKTDADKMDPKRIIVLKARQAFARGSGVSLHWLKDFDYTVTKVFNVEFSCARETAASACIPLNDMNLLFTDQIAGVDAQKVYLQLADGTKIKPMPNPSGLKSGVRSVTFKAPFMPNTKYTVVLKNIKSLDGEKLVNENAFPLNVSTTGLPSLLKVDRTFGVIESSNPVLPVTLRQIENPVPGSEKSVTFQSATQVLDYRSVSQTIQLLKAVTQARPEKPMQDLKNFKTSRLNFPKKLKNDKTEVIGIPLKGNGLHFVELQSEILGGKLVYEPKPNQKYYVRSLALVTDLNITVKFSKSEVLAWVTSLQSGQPVKDATVTLFDHEAHQIKEMKTDDKGVANFQISDSERDTLSKQTPGSYGMYNSGFFTFARLKDDFSFVWSKDSEGLESYRFNLSLPYRDPEFIYHAILERNLLRPKEVLRAKLIYRKVEKVGLSIPKLTLPKQVQLKSSLYSQKTLVPVKWDKTNGTGTIEWAIPEEAQVGDYTISFPDVQKDNETDTGSEDAEVDTSSSSKVPHFGTFTVEDFKIPNISTELRAEKTPWIQREDPQVEFSARYLSGGAAAGLPVKVRYSVEKSGANVSNPDYSEFVWRDGTVEEGIRKTNSETNRNNQPKINQLDLKLDKFGLTKFNLKGLNYTADAQTAVVSVEYKDANGEIKTMTRAYPLLSSDQHVGVRAKSWYQTAQSFEYEAAVLDINEKPLANQSVTLALYKVDNYSTRKKILGGFYTYESYTEVQKVKDLCTEQTNTEGKISCKGSDTSLSGEYFIVARHKDSRGRMISSRISNYLSGKSDFWYGGSDSDRMDLIPFKKSYEPGEEAEFQVRGPISEGQLLVTVERGGILQSFVKNFSQKDPVVRLKILADWAPNVVVSAVLLRGRIEGKVTGLLDLGKPSLKMGMSSIKVGIKRHILNVKVTTAKTEYKPRESVSANVMITDSEGKPVNGEIAVAAIDEGLLALKSNSTWNLIDVMLPLRAHSVNTAYMMSQVIGKRTMGLKAVPSGGDGSGAAVRELFESSLYWNPRLTVKNGVAKFSFKANDSLTSFKIVAIAQSGADRFGTGSSQIRINKEIQTYPALALAVRGGDQYLARFNVRNTKDKDTQLEAQLKLNGVALETKKIELAAGQAQELSWPVQADDHQTEQKIELTVLENGQVADTLKFKQPIQAVWPMRSVGNSFSQEASVSVPIVRPDSAHKSELQLTAIPTLASTLPGVKKFWDNYAYDCFEQRLSRAVSTNSENLFKDLMKVSESYLDSDGLIKFYPGSRYGSVFLTNYVLQITHYKGWDLNEGFRKKSLEGLNRFFNGTLIAQDFYNKTYLEMIRIETLDTMMRYGLGSPEAFTTLKYKLEMLPNYYLAHLISILKQRQDIPKHADLLNQALQLVRSRTVMSSTRLTLKDSVAQDYWGMYIFEDVSFSKILLGVLDTGEFKADGGRFILSYLEFAKNGSWYNTMANAWANVTLEDYKKVFEKTPVNGTLKWGLEGQELKTDKIQNERREIILPYEGHQKAVSQFSGDGKPWINVMVTANPALTEDRMHGIDIQKTWKPVDVKDVAKKTAGDVWEITLTVKSKSEFQWLAIRDPLPPGAMVISEDNIPLSAKKALEYQIYENWFYGEAKVYKYQIRLNQSGSYILPSTRAEAMYDTDLYGEKLNEKIVIEN